MKKEVWSAIWIFLRSRVKDFIVSNAINVFFTLNFLYLAVRQYHEHNGMAAYAWVLCTVWFVWAGIASANARDYKRLTHEYRTLYFETLKNWKLYRQQINQEGDKPCQKKERLN